MQREQGRRIYCKLEPKAPPPKVASCSSFQVCILEKEKRRTAIFRTIFNAYNVSKTFPLPSSHRLAGEGGRDRQRQVKTDEKRHGMRCRLCGEQNKLILPPLALLNLLRLLRRSDEERLSEALLRVGIHWLHSRAHG